MDSDDQLADAWQHGGYPYANLMGRKTYEAQKYHHQVELLKLQAWIKESGQRLVILFEGRDAAGKGGTIKRFMEHLNPRGTHVTADLSMTWSRFESRPGHQAEPRPSICATDHGAATPIKHPSAPLLRTAAMSATADKSSACT